MEEFAIVFQLLKIQENDWMSEWTKLMNERRKEIIVLFHKHEERDENFMMQLQRNYEWQP